MRWMCTDRRSGINPPVGSSRHEKNVISLSGKTNVHTVNVQGVFFRERVLWRKVNNSFLHLHRGKDHIYIFTGGWVCCLRISILSN